MQQTAAWQRQNEDASVVRVPAAGDVECWLGQPDGGLRSTVGELGMLSIVIRVVLSLALAYILLLCASAAIGIWRAPIDESLTIRAIWRPIHRALTAPIGIIRVLQVKGLVHVELLPRPSTATIQPEGPAVVHAGDVAGTTNYTLTIQNRNAFPLLDVHLVLQLPFSIVRQTICRREFLQGLELSPLASAWDFTAPDGGSVSFPRTPRGPRTELTIARVEPHGRIELALLLDTASRVWLEALPGSKETDAVSLFVDLSYFREVAGEPVQRLQFHRLSVPSGAEIRLGSPETTRPSVLDMGGVDF